MNHLTDQFFTAAQSHAGHGSRIERLLQSELPEIRAELGNTTQIQDVCLIADAGEFITHTLEILAHFAIDAVYGHHITHYADARISSLVQEHDLSDLEIVDYLDDKHAALKYLIHFPEPIEKYIADDVPRSIAQDIDSVATRSRTCWNQSPPQPVLPRLEERRLSTPNLIVESTSGTPGGTEMTPNSSMASSVVSPQGHTLVQSSQGSAGVLAPIEELKPRGKGQYLCPEGLSCTKGGVQADGTLVVFERNSAFRLAVPFRVAVFVGAFCSKNRSYGGGRGK